MDTGVDRILYNDSFHPLMSKKLQKQAFPWLARSPGYQYGGSLCNSLLNRSCFDCECALDSNHFFVDKDFHLWMLLAVFPTTLASIMIGCKKHRDRWVGGACLLGLSLLLIAFLSSNVVGRRCLPQHLLSMHTQNIACLARSSRAL